jgi:hypothetical protein
VDPPAATPTTAGRGGAPAGLDSGGAQPEPRRPAGRALVPVRRGGAGTAAQRGLPLTKTPPVKKGV